VRCYLTKVPMLEEHVSLLHQSLQGYYCSEISGNLEMSGNSAKVRKKAHSLGKIRKRSVNLYSHGNLIAQQLNKITYLYSIRTVIHFSYVRFMENLYQ